MQNWYVVGVGKWENAPRGKLPPLQFYSTVVMAKCLLLSGAEQHTIQVQQQFPSSIGTLYLFNKREAFSTRIWKHFYSEERHFHSASHTCKSNTPNALCVACRLPTGDDVRYSCCSREFEIFEQFARHVYERHKKFNNVKINFEKVRLGC